MRKTCRNCKHKVTGGFEEPCLICVDYGEWEPLTNADRLRDMSDAELAEVLCLIYGGLGPVQSDDGRAWLDWLKKEADNETTD